jgi:hypothetical protein
LSQINPDLELEQAERAELAQMTLMPGYKVLHKLMRSQVDQFIVAMINADPAEPEDVLAKQVTMKAAAQFYQGITNRVNHETTLYTHAPRETDKPVDVTEGVLDMGAVADAVEALPNLL